MWLRNDSQVSGPIDRISIKKETGGLGQDESI
jgi:hypothetical protein